MLYYFIYDLGMGKHSKRECNGYIYFTTGCALLLLCIKSPWWFELYNVNTTLMMTTTTTVPLLKYDYDDYNHVLFVDTSI